MQTSSGSDFQSSSSYGTYFDSEVRKPSGRARWLQSCTLPLYWYYFLPQISLFQLLVGPQVSHLATSSTELANIRPIDDSLLHLNISSVDTAEAIGVAITLSGSVLCSHSTQIQEFWIFISIFPFSSFLPSSNVLISCCTSIPSKLSNVSTLQWRRF